MTTFDIVGASITGFLAYCFIGCIAMYYWGKRICNLEYEREMLIMAVVWPFFLIGMITLFVGQCIVYIFDTLTYPFKYSYNLGRKEGLKERK